MTPDLPYPVVASITILGSGRLGPTASAAFGLIGTVIGGLALARARRGALAASPVAAFIDRRGPLTALVLGLLGVALGGLFLASADGGPGTGSGVVGSVAAVVLGLIAIVLARIATARRHDPDAIEPFRRTADA